MVERIDHEWLDWRVLEEEQAKVESAGQRFLWQSRFPPGAELPRFAKRANTRNTV